MKTKKPLMTIKEKLKEALVPENEQPYPIPENWVWTKLGVISSVITGKTPPTADPQYTENDDLPFITPAAFNMSDSIRSSDRYVSNAATRVAPLIPAKSTLLTSIGATLGKVAILEMPAVINQQINALIPRAIDAAFIFRWTCSQVFQEIMWSKSSATTLPIINKSRCEQLPIPIAPLPEQRRIAEKLESLLGKIKKAKVFLDEIPEILQNFRQTVLAAACSGRLTEDWRKGKPNEKSSFLAQKKTKELQIFNMPKTWAVVMVNEVASRIEYGYTASSSKAPVGPKLLRITDIQDGKVNWDDVPYCEIEEQKKAKFLLLPGDIVFARTGATTGKSFIIENCPEVVFASYLIRIKPNNEIMSKYMYFFFQSDIYWAQIHENISGIAQPNCNATKLSSLLLPLPPIAEQQEIVRYVESLFKKADDLEVQYKDAMELIETLPEIILSKAFRGELLPQDPNDESASVWLKRIIQSLDKKEPIEIQRKSFGLDARNMMNYKMMDSCRI